MKTLIIIFFSLFTGCIYLQNPFVDGIHSAKIVEYKEGNTKYTLFGFKINLPDEFTVNYSYTKDIVTPNFNRTYTISSSWKWKDIASIEEDTMMNTLRLNGRDCMPLKQLDMDTKEVTYDNCNDNAIIYYRDKAALKSAISWVYDVINKQGGKVIMLN